VNPNLTFVLPFIAMTAAGLPMASAAISYTAEGLLVTQNFNALPAVNTTLVGTGVVGIQVALPGASDWEVARRGGSATTDTAINVVYSTGGRFYSAGSAVSDRAVAALGSGAFFGAVGTSLVNNSGVTLTSFTVSYAHEIWAVQGTGTQNAAEDRMAFAYGFSGGTATAANYLTNSSLIALADLDAVSPASNMVLGAASGDNPNRQRDGNSAGFRTLKTATVSGISWEPGASLYLRWSDSDSPGFDATQGIDDFAFSAVPEPSVWISVMVGAAAVLLPRRRW
jgi:hypothetical protein